MSFLIEKGIEPLVRALNELDFAATVYSCEGHFDGEQREMFLPTAYVTFDVSDVGQFRGLYERLHAFDGSARAARLRLTYDCILGRYTLSIWPDASIESPRHKRESVDAAVALLANIVVDYARSGKEKETPNSQTTLQIRGTENLSNDLNDGPPGRHSHESGNPSEVINSAQRDMGSRLHGNDEGEKHSRSRPPQSPPPCRLSDSLFVPPCTLVIPPKEFICPFVKREEGLERQR